VTKVITENFVGARHVSDAPPPLQDATILLVDDIFTTRYQLDAVGRRLLASGATRVDGLVLARRSWNS
jgi:predicted amidophosphoribosyltransferase